MASSSPSRLTTRRRATGESERATGPDRPLRRGILLVLCSLPPVPRSARWMLHHRHRQVRGVSGSAVDDAAENTEGRGGLASRRAGRCGVGFRSWWWAGSVGGGGLLGGARCGLIRRSPRTGSACTARDLGTACPGARPRVWLGCRVRRLGPSRHALPWALAFSRAEGNVPGTCGGARTFGADNSGGHR